MNDSSKTMAQSRAWAADLCERLERSAVCYDYWYKEYHATKSWSQWRVYRRFGCFRMGLIQRMKGGFDAFMETPLERT